MVFPATILDLRVELLLGSLGWTDVSAYVKQDSGVTVTRGHADESTVTNPSSVAMPLINADGRFSSRNPLGPYYGNLVRNTQVRVSVPEGASYLRLEGPDQFSFASTPDSAGTSVAGDTEIQVDVTLGNWNANQVLASKWTASGNQRSWILLLNDDGTLSFTISTLGSAISGTATSSTPVPVPPLGRQAIKVTWVQVTGVTTFYTAPAALNQAPLGPITTGWVQVGSVRNTGANAVFDGTAPTRVGAPGTAATADFTAYTGISGKVHSLKLLNGIGGTVVASPDFTTQTPGAGSFNDAQGNTWSLTGSGEISNRKYRVHAEVVSWPQSWDPSGTDVTVAMTASGMLRRVGQGTRRRLGVGGSPLLSAIRRYWLRLTGSLAPVAYWPCEDTGGRFASGFPDADPMTVTAGKPTFASSTAFAGSSALPVLNLSSWQGSVPFYTGNDAVCTCLVTIPAGGDQAGATLAAMYTTGTADLVWVEYDTATGGNLTLVADLPGTGLTFTSSITNLNGTSFVLRFAARKSGADVIYTMQTMPPGGAVTTQSVTTTTATVGRATLVQVNTLHQPSTTVLLNGTSAGHVAFQGTWESLATTLAVAPTPVTGWTGETAGNRFVRLCGEEGYLTRTRGRLATTIPMGPQSIATLMALLQECADADRGQIYEPREGLCLGYRTRSSLQNQAPAVALNYAAFHLAGSLIPVDDDQQIQNDVTVTRTGGSSFRKQLFSGPLSIQPPPLGSGPYPAAATLNFQSDSLARQEAGWLLHLGTVDENRFPLIQLELARTAVSGLFYDLQDTGLGDRITVASMPVWTSPNSLDQLVQQTTERMGGYIYQIDWTGVPAAPYATGLVGSSFRLDTDGSTLNGSLTSTGQQPSVASSGALWTTALTAGWSFTVSGTPGDAHHFIVTTAQSASITVGDIFTDTTNPTQAFQVTAIGVPFVGFVNISFAPNAGSNMNNPDVVTQSLGDFPFDVKVAGERITVAKITGASSPQTFTIIRSVNGVVKAQAGGAAVALFAPSAITLS